MEATYVSLGPLMLVLLGLSPSGLPLSVPPLPEDKALVSAAPEECLFYLSWYGTAEAKSASGNRVEQLLAEPEIRQLLATLWKEVHAAAGRQGAPMLRTTLPLASTVLTRPTSIFVSKFDVELREAGPPEFDVQAGAIVHAGDQAGAMKELLLTLERGLMLELRGEVEEVTVQDVKLRQLPMPAGAPTVQWGFHGQYLVFAVGDGSAQRMIASLKAARGPPAWLKQLHQRLPLQRPSTVQYLNLRGIAQAVQKALGPRGAIVEGGLAALGLDNVESLAAVSGLDGSDLATKTLLATAGKPRGVLSLVSDKPLQATDLAAIPRDASWAVAKRADLAAAYRLVLDTIGRVAPEGVRAIVDDELSQLEDALGFRILADLLEPLGDTWTVHNAPSQGGFFFTGVCATVTLRDRKRLEQTHARILKLIRGLFPHHPEPVREFTFRGQKVYMLNVGTPQQSVAPAWCLTDTQLIVTLYPQTLKSQLARTKDDGSLADVPEVAGLLKGRPAVISYQDTPRFVRTFYPVLQFLAPAIAHTLQQVGIDVDASILPSAQAIYPHLRPAVGSVARTEQGIVCINRQSTPGSLGATTMGPVAVALLLPAVQAAREAARRTQSSNNLKQLALAMHNYHDVHNRLPAPANYDKDGKPLLSWRVHVLPYIEQQALYRKFRLHEPWDSEHNRKLIKEMPEVFQNPNRPSTDGKTYYVVPRGENTMFPKGRAGSMHGIGFASVTDGLSNTIMIVETGPAGGVTWTKPDDWVFNPKAPRAKLFGMRPGAFLAARGDGSVTFISESSAAEVLRAMFSRNGGERVDAP